MKKYNLKNERIGQKFNINGDILIVKDYIDALNVYVYFENFPNDIIKATWQHILDNNIKNKNKASVYGVGIIGSGQYKPFLNGKSTKTYDTWRNMLYRCYDEKYKDKYPTYIDCRVCEEWLNFQEFAKWCNENYYEINGEIMCLDKDILIKGNKIYSPENCIFVSNSINTLFTKSNGARGEFHIGVSFNKDKQKYGAHINKYGKLVHLGYYTTPELAFQTYKKAKEEYIKEVAEQYKDKIPQKLYDALYKWEVDIND